MRLLVTGRNGFVGSALAGLVASQRDLAHWDLVDVPDAFQILDQDATRNLVEDAAPDAVIHLAAQSNIPAATSDPAETLRINVLGTLNLLQALKRAGFRGRMVFAGTGDVYGKVPEASLPVTESMPPRPRNPYAVSKVAAEALCFQWTVTEKMDIVLARPFNHIGPGQREDFVVAGLSRRIAQIVQGRAPPRVDVGDIDVTRDFSDVRDVVRAYFALLEHGEPGEIYNVCSGQERSVRSLLMKLVELAGVDVEIHADPARFRPAEQRRMCGSADRLRAASGWRTMIPIEQSLADTLAHWEAKGAVHA